MSIYDPMSRRFFLRSSCGALIGIPFLESLLPRRAWAATAAPPIRYVQVVQTEGMHWDFWYGSLGKGPMLAGPNGVYYHSLSQVSGPMSINLGTAFDGIRGKMNVMRGLDAIGAETHVTGLATTCSASTENGFPLWNLSADQAIAYSSVIYPAGVPNGGTRFLALGPSRNAGVSAEKKFTFSFRNSTVPLAEKSSQALAQAFPTGAGSGAAPVAASPASQKLKIVDQIKADYDRVRQSRQIGSADSQRLSNFMSLLSDLQRSFGGSDSSTPSSNLICTLPTASDSESGYSNRIKRLIDIAVAALACGNTNVAHLALTDHAFGNNPLAGDFDGGPYHDLAMHSHATHQSNDDERRGLNAWSPYQRPTGTDNLF